LGLVGINERVALVGGKLNIESEPDCGATLAIRIPAPASVPEEAFAYERAAHFLSR
jgi:signal transduction histidine kinase